MLLVLVDERGGDDRRDVQAGFAGKRAEAAELPVIVRAGARDRAGDAPLAGIVGRHGEVPVAEEIVEVAEIAGRGLRRLDRVRTLVDDPRAPQAVTAPRRRDELPDSLRPGAGAGS